MDEIIKILTEKTKSKELRWSFMKDAYFTIIRKKSVILRRLNVSTHPNGRIDCWRMEYEQMDIGDVTYFPEFVNLVNRSVDDYNKSLQEKYRQELLERLTAEA